MTGSACKRWTLHVYVRRIYRGRESEGGRGAKDSRLNQGWRMTGSACKRWTLHVNVRRINRGRESEGGRGLGVARDWRLADLYFGPLWGFKSPLRLAKSPLRLARVASKKWLLARRRLKIQEIQLVI